MRTSMIVLVALTVGMATPLFATPVKIAEFSPLPGASANWTYQGTVLSFDEAAIDKALGADDDALVGALVHIPTFQVGNVPGGPYTLTPLGDPDVTITNEDGTVTYLTGTLGVGDLGTIGTVAGGYTSFASDVTNIIITSEGETLGSAALALLGQIESLSLDFELSLQGGSGAGYYTFAEMIDGDYTGSGGFSGAMSVPEPTTLGMLCLGGIGLLRKRRNKY